MFNPNSARPIGTRKFEEHVLDVMTSHYYEYQIPGSGIPKDLSGERLWKSEPETDPYDNLVIAVIAVAVSDYVDAYARREQAKAEGDIKGETLWDSRCIELENDFFHQYDETEMVFEMLLNTIRRPDGLLDMQKNCMKRYYRYMEEARKNQVRTEQ